MDKSKIAQEMKGPPEMKGPKHFNIFKYFTSTCTFYLKFPIESDNAGFSFWYTLFLCNFFLTSFT